MCQYDYLEEMKDDEIDLVEITKIIVKRKVLIIGVAILVSIISLIAGGINYSRGKSVTTIIGYSYEDIDKGLNPDGSQFTIGELKNNIIARRVYDKYPILKEKGITLTDFIFSIKIQGIIPSDISNLTETNLKKGKKFMYNPVDYKITLRLTGDTKLDAEILTDLTTEYILYFNQKYKSSEIVPLIKINDFSGYDYLDIVRVLDSNIEIVNNITLRLVEKPFVSKRVGLTYEDIDKLLTNLKEIDLKNISSTVEISNITNNISERKRVLNNNIRTLNLEKKKAGGKAEVIRGMLKDYKPDARKVMLPTLGESEIKISTEEKYYTSLLKDYETTATEIKNLEIDIAEETRKLNELSDNKEIKKQVEKQIELVINKYNFIISKMNIMNKEYYNKYFSDSVRVMSQTSVVSNSKANIIVLAGIILGIMMGLGSAFIAEFIDYYHKNKHKVK